jgi:phage antirepressor YoqD-like protein
LILEQLQAPSFMIVDPIRRAERWSEEQKDTKAIQQQYKLLKKSLQEQEVAAAYAKGVLKSREMLTTVDIAKDLGMNPSDLYKTLFKRSLVSSVRNGKDGNKYLTLDSTCNSLLQEGYVEYHIHKDGQRLMWTKKGRSFIYKKLMDMGNLKKGTGH